ncbi:hypothetical protein IscW_ISCW021503 [Ixodes scapularis]|uniref:Uncharacterized protein n=1 Tax=Ixodes scapularis TaxID=6945 RepID=B7Q4Z8_IXOSC|nr:hypothetical protein IscW_ISCW021503 [Ixodes scapularis]|eukprot:XP_002411656.1 hypothetical protein IscW_ISCW021503 [Ixodes scapularis]
MRFLRVWLKISVSGSGILILCCWGFVAAGSFPAVRLTSRRQLPQGSQITRIVGTCTNGCQPYVVDLLLTTNELHPLCRLCAFPTLHILIDCAIHICVCLLYKCE